MPLQSFALSKSELDAYQVLVLDKRIDRTLIVTGCAGSGKSVLAIHKAGAATPQPKRRPAWRSIPSIASQISQNWNP